MNILSKGIDIYKWQREFPMERAKAEGFNFVIIKGGGGDGGLYTDGQFARNKTRYTKIICYQIAV